MRRSLLPTCLVVALALLGLSCSGPGGGDAVRIPEYPRASEDQRHQASIQGLASSIVRFVTEDPYDEVFAFYAERLEAYDPQLMAYTLEDGRQAAMTVEADEQQSVTVAIQELKHEGLVTITVMKVGS